VRGNSFSDPSKESKHSATQSKSDQRDGESPTVRESGSTGGAFSNQISTMGHSSRRKCTFTHALEDAMALETTADADETAAETLEETEARAGLVTVCR
jgi:hypothetical protein